MKKACGIIFIFLKTVFVSYGQTTGGDSLFVNNFADKAPEPKGGQAAIHKWIAENVNKELVKGMDSIICDSPRSGKVMIVYTIDEQGILSLPEVAYGLGEPYDSEALRLITQMQIEWTPGKKDGNNVKVRTGTAISFCNRNEKDKRKKKKIR